MDLAKTNELLKEAIEEGGRYLPRLIEGLSKVVTLLQGGHEGEATALFVESIEGLEWFQTVVTSTELFREDLSGYHLVTRYEKALNELLEAWENRDLVLVSDLLEFEVIPVIEKFLEITNQGKEN